MSDNADTAAQVIRAIPYYGKMLASCRTYKFLTTGHDWLSPPRTPGKPTSWLKPGLHPEGVWQPQGHHKLSHQPSWILEVGAAGSKTSASMWGMANVLIAALIWSPDQ